MRLGFLETSGHDPKRIQPFGGGGGAAQRFGIGVAGLADGRMLKKIRLQNTSCSKLSGSNNNLGKRGLKIHVEQHGQEHDRNVVIDEVVKTLAKRAFNDFLFASFYALVELVATDSFLCCGVLVLDGSACHGFARRTHGMWAM